jgi:hypothetical protein
MTSAKRAVVDAVCPLQDAGILLHMMNILGPGQHLFISAVSKAWRDSYAKVADVKMYSWSIFYDEGTVQRIITSKTTLCSAAFASASRVSLAHKYDLKLFDGSRFDLHRIAGRVADIPTLRAAHELGLTPSYMSSLELLKLPLCRSCDGYT